MVVLGGLFGTNTLNELLPDSAPKDLQRPLTGGTWIGAFADALVFFAPVVVLLGLVAGIGVVVRCWQPLPIKLPLRVHLKFPVLSRWPAPMCSWPTRKKPPRK